MPLFNYWPYLDLFKQNLDWLLKTVQECQESISKLPDQIQAAVNQWITEHPEAITTVEDNSLTVQKFTEETRLATINTELTPEMFGAAGDGVTDDSIPFQRAINAALEQKKKLVAGSKSYLIGTGLMVQGYRNPTTLQVERGRNVDIDLSTCAITYTGSAYAFTFTMIESGSFRFGDITAEAGGGLLLQSSDRFSYVNYFNIDGNNIYANAGADCIRVTNSGGGWTNQNRISNIKFSHGLYACHFISNSTNKINEWIIENVSLEGVENGHYMEAHSESDIAIYIESIKFLFNRAVEHIGNGKTFLKTYGRVQDCLISSYYGSFQLPSAYEFNYDNSGTLTYTHIANKIEIDCQNAKCRIINGKMITNPHMFESSCNITHIGDAADDADTAYRNYYGTLQDFMDKIPSFYPANIDKSLYANLNTKWLAGSPTDTAANKQLEQTLITQGGSEFKRRIQNNRFSDWVMHPVIKTERKVLHGSTFSVDFSAIGFLVLTNLSTSYVAIYFVRFGTEYDPIKVFSTLSTDWTIARVDNFTLSFSNEAYSSGEQMISFIQVG